ncbi:dolichol kinase [Halosimplex litoreum]|uniref:Dolichol kinase n=1 Tax=Halosimplex litoreum TaxID=1198301 RepID=A0A7U3WB96_9EURY|nr:dolichol kinase [Halosimplex litoreum]QPV64891.1 dolichol kinase [Halosimplex litoreum]
MRDEIVRRMVHASGTAVPLAYLFVPGVEWIHVQALLVAGLGVALVLEVVRLVVGLDWWIYEKLTREYEQDNLAGYFLAVFSMAVVALVFPPPSAAETLVRGLEPSRVAVPAILMLTIADPVSGLLGSGELRTAKEVTVLLVTFAVATLLAVPFVTPLAAVLGGVAATVADGIKPVISGYVIDDNLSIPLASAAVMFLAVQFLPASPL